MMEYGSEIFAGVALGVSLSTYFAIWYLQGKMKRHYRFMIGSLEARLGMLETQVDKIYDDLYDQNTKG